VKRRKNSLKKFATQVEAAIETKRAEDQRPLLIMAQDEARFGRISRPKRCWAPPGIRPVAPAQVVREAVSVFASVTPSLGKICSLILPTANTDMMTLFLQHVSQTFSDSFIVMQVDQASWHHSKALEVPENIRLIKQPPYSRSASIPSNIFGTTFEKNTSIIVFSHLLTC